MKAVSARVVEKTWREMAGLTPAQGRELVTRMADEQPVILAYLTTVDQDILNQDERELLFYLGMVVWQMMSKGKTPPPKVTIEGLDKAEEANLEMLRSLASAPEEESGSAMARILTEYGQPEILRYVVEAIVEAVENNEIREESSGILMMNLKTVIDSLNA